MNTTFFGVSRAARLRISAACAIVAVLGAIAPLSAAQTRGTGGAVQPPVISGLSPKTGQEGDSVTITGQHFKDVSGVTFAGMPATYSVTNPRTIVATVPKGARTGVVSVTTRTGRANGPSFTVASSTPGTKPEPKPSPTIDRLVPETGSAGDQIRIRGMNLSGVIVVAFNGVTAQFTNESDRSVLVTVPRNVKTGTVVVTTRNGRAASPRPFVVSTTPEPVGRPAITTFSPATGSRGDSVEIKGQNFTGTTGVTFGAANARFSVVNDRTITAVVPAGARTGAISVETPAGRATSRDTFTVQQPALRPTVTGFNPDRGVVGDTVRVDGTNFDGVQAVDIGGVAGAFTVVSATRLRFTIPPKARTGAITVRTQAGSASSAQAYTVLSDAVTLSVDRFTPDRGKVGDAVTIVGAGFENVRRVEFNGASARFTVQSATRIQATVPQAATTGPITVATSSKRVASRDRFTVVYPELSKFRFEDSTYYVRATDRRFTIWVSRGGDTTARSSVEIAAQDRTARQGRDYRLNVSRLVFAPGEKRKSMDVVLLNDPGGRGERDFDVALRRPDTNAQLGNPALTRATIFYGDQGQPQLWVSSTSLSFGRVRLGETTTQTFTVRNSGRGTLTFDLERWAGNETFSISSWPSRTRLAAGESTSFRMTFQPRWRPGTYTGALNVRSNAGNRTINLSGEALGEPAPMLSLTTSGVDFGNVRPGNAATWPVYYRNSGGSRIRVYNATILNGGSNGFYIARGPSDGDLGPRDTGYVSVGFNPRSGRSGFVSGLLRIDSSAGSATVFLRGYVTAEPFLIVEPQSLDFGTVDLGDEVTGNVTLYNAGDAPLRAVVALRSDAGRSFFGEFPREYTINPRSRVNVPVGFNPIGSYGQYLSGALEVSSTAGYAVVSLQGQVRYNESSVQPPQYIQPSVVIDGPTSEASLTGGEPADIRFSAWDDNEVTGFLVAYSTDGGLSYPFKIADVDASTRLVTWDVPDALQTSDARIRVLAVDRDGNTTAAYSELLKVIPPAAVARVELTPSPVPNGRIAPPASIGTVVTWLDPMDENGFALAARAAVSVDDWSAIAQPGGRSGVLVGYDVYRVFADGDTPVPAAAEIAANPDNYVGSLPVSAAAFVDFVSSAGWPEAVYVFVSRYEDGTRSAPSSAVRVTVPAAPNTQ